MKRLIIFILSLTLLLPNLVLAQGEGISDIKEVIERGFLEKEGLDRKINRAELATVSIRLMGLEKSASSYKGKIYYKDIEKFQGGWAVPYISLAKEHGIMEGVSKDKFNPQYNVSYVEVLTVLMRILGYEDGIDFIDFPQDYYKKALEIGLGDMRISPNEKVTRMTVALTIEKALNSRLRDEDYTLLEKLDKVPQKEIIVEEIKLDNLKFNTSIAGIFSGELKGSSDFTGYRVALLSKKGRLYKEKILGKDGKFVINDFDIGLLPKLDGYKYEIYNSEGKLILSDNL